MHRNIQITLLWLGLVFAAAAHSTPSQPPVDGQPADAGADAPRIDAPSGNAGVDAQRDADRALQERLAARLAVIPGLEKVRVEVAGGVATLSGEAADDGRRQLAATIAAQATGVDLVENQLAIDTDLRVRIRPVLQEAGDRLVQLVAALPLLLIAAAIVYLAWWLGRWLAGRQRIVSRARRNPFLASLLRQAIQIGVVLVGVVVALDLLNATALAGALLGTAGIVGIALGFAFRDVAENYIAGILLSLRQPFAPHDHVLIDGHEGKVAALTTRATVLITLDGNHLRLPNALVFKGVTLNYSRNPTRRFSFELGIANEASVSHAQDVAMQTLTGMDALLAEPAPAVLLARLGDSSTVLSVSAWVDQRTTSFGRARSEAIRLLRRAFAQAGIDMPDPGYRVELLGSGTIAGQRSPASPPDQGASGTVEAATTADVSVEQHIDRQVDAEQAELAGDNLLDPNARRE